MVAVTDREKDVRNGGSTAFLVDRAMGWRSEFIQTMGEGGPASLIFDDVRVPARNILGEIGQGFDAGHAVDRQGPLPDPVARARHRRAGAGHGHRAREHPGDVRPPIGTNQAIQWMIADSEVELEAARWLVLRAAWTVDQGEDPRHASSMAKLYGAGMVNRVVDRVMQIHGGMGYTRELPIERWYRQVRLMRIFEGTDEMQRLIIARDLLRGYTTDRRAPGMTGCHVVCWRMTRLLAESWPAAHATRTRSRSWTAAPGSPTASCGSRPAPTRPACASSASRPGDTVAHPDPERAGLPAGLLRRRSPLGAVVVPVHLLLTADEMAYVLRDSGADVLIAHSSQLRSAPPPRTPPACRLVTVGPLPVGLADAPPRLEDAAAAVPPLRTYADPRGRGHRGRLLHQRHHRAAQGRRC